MQRLISFIRGVTRGGGHQSRGPLVGGFGAAERQDPEAGQLIVEILIAFGLASILIPAVILGFISGSNGRVQQEQRLKATGYLREAEEAIRSVRDLDWNNIATNGTYHPVPGPTHWSLATGTETIGDFGRSIVISDVSPVDLSKKQITITVNWNNILPSFVTSTFYLARWKNLSLADTQEVIEQAGGFNDWCKPSLTTTNVNLNRQGHATTVDAFPSSNNTGNRIFTGTGANSSGPAFSNLIIQGNSPPALISDTDYDGTPSVKANGVFGDTNYAYLATDSQGVEILSLASAPYQQVGSFNPHGMKPANGIYVVGDTGYVVTDDKLYIFSISANRTSTTQIGVMNLTGGQKIIVDGNNQYAYVMTTDTNDQFKIIDVHTNQANPSVHGQLKLNDAVGRGEFIDFTKMIAYVVTAFSVAQPEFYMLNISNPASPSILPNGTYDTGGIDPQGVTIVTGSRAIVVGCGEAFSKTGHEYQVFSVLGNQVAPCPNHADNNDFLNIDAGVYGVSTIFQTDKHAYSYIVTGDAAAELKIIEGGSGDGGVGGSGYYESPTLPIPDPGHDVAWNSFTATADPNLSYAISIKHGVGGSCSSVTFSDSDFTAFAPGILPLATLGTGYTNPGECMRYRAINSGITPVTYTITFNYSP